MDLNDAIEIHREWKLKLRRAVIAKESLDEASISADNCCTLGQWLHGEAKQKYGKLKSYADCVEKHAIFHQCAGKVVNVINARNYAEAEAMLAANTEYMIASVDIAQAVETLKIEAGL